MKIPAFPFLITLSTAIAVAGCSKIPSDTEKTVSSMTGCGVVTIDLGTKASNCRLLSCVLFAMDEDGKVVQKDSCLFTDPYGGGKLEWKLASGTYRIWCVANGGPSSKDALWKCDWSKEIEDVAHSLEEQEKGASLLLLTVDGNDNVFTLSDGEIKQVLLAGKPLTAKICLHNIVNKTSFNTLPAYGPVSVKCLEAVLLNVPDSMTVSNTGNFALRNNFSSKTLDLMSGCVCAMGSRQEIPPDDSGEENLVMYCFPNDSYTENLILSVCICLADDNVRWYNIPVGTVRSGYEYTVSNLIILKEGATSPFILTPTSDFSPDASPCQWDIATECGLTGGEAVGPMSFNLSTDHVFLDDPPANWTCDFSEIYGSASVSSSRTDHVCVRGAGKFWTLYATGNGHSTLTLNDGLSSKNVPVCVGPSITWTWEDCKGNAWNPSKKLMTYQRCRLKTNSFYGILTASTAGSMFELSGRAEDGNLTFMHPDGKNEIELRDYFETTKLSFPYETSDWDIMDCPRVFYGEEGVVERGELTLVSISLPFNFSESAIAPTMFVDDPNNNMIKAKITLYDTYDDNYFTITANTECKSDMTDLGISVYCIIGDKNRKIMEINSCKTFIIK